MTASICGFDIGTENCYIGIARKGGIEIILNDFSQRSTPGYVCLFDEHRDLGVTAKQKQSTNLNSTFYNLRRIIGRQYQDVIQEEKLAFKIFETETGEVAICKKFQGEDHFFTATQLLAMVFTKLKQLSNNPSECVINCPNYFTDSQRRALKIAARIADMNVSRILPDLSAIALYYCFYRVNAKEENNQLIVFIDIGASSTQCSVVEYNPKKHIIRVLALEYDSNLGGRVFDEIIMNYFIEKSNLVLNERSIIRLKVECEKLKKQMSANSNDLPINIECLYDDKDWSGVMSRSLFEDLCKNEFSKIENIFKQVLESATSKIKKDSDDNENLNFSAIEIVGGSSRIPAIRRIVKNVFGVEPTSTLNADEAVALGCTLQSTLLSPNYKVLRNFQIIDYQPYQINCRYWAENDPNKRIHQISPFFQKGSVFPFTRQILFNCYSLPITFELDYINNLNESVVIGQYKISFHKKEFVPCKIKIRVRLNNSGLVEITSATLEEIKEDNIEENGKDENSKKEVEVIELEVSPNWIKGDMNNTKLDYYRNIEYNLNLADKNWNDKIDALNELEEYIYEWKQKMEDPDYFEYLEKNDQLNFLFDLKNAQKWLLKSEEIKETHNKSIYVEVLRNLKSKFSDRILSLRKEKEFVNSYTKKIDDYITECFKLFDDEDMKDVEDNSKFKTLLESTSTYNDEVKNCLSFLPKSDMIPKNQDKEEVQKWMVRLEKGYNQIFEKLQKIKQDKLKKKSNDIETVTAQDEKVEQKNNHETNSNETNQMDIDK